ncbi:MAG TPA: serine/threonine-protein kinase, partial [Isosphaeraceae bacterium]|nr:serine/threonine-protein kinase [Isosphaeraceae bacterium]
MSSLDADRNLLFGVLALQQDLIDAGQFADACGAWAVQKEKPLADLLVARGWISAEDRRAVERFLDRKLKRHGGDVHATLGALADVEARDAIRRVDDPDVRKSLSSLPPAAGYVMLETVAKAPSEGTLRYSLSRLHAEGGLGEVWVARDNDLNREVALKIIKPEQSAHPEMWRRFLKEARITGQLEHPNIVPVYELTRRPGDDQPFYTMRFVRGRTLHDAIRDYHKDPADRLAFQSLLGAFIAVCRAVGYAHSRGVIHRDLKPANVVLGGFGEVIVLDWGLAKLVDRPDDADESALPLTLGDDAETSATRGQVGTPSYMAPEQVEARHDLIDTRTDVYALGAILFEVLTNRPPAVGKSLDEVYRSILTGPLPRARDLNPSAPRPLEAIATKALARDRSKRYANPLDLADDVRRWIAD